MTHARHETARLAAERLNRRQEDVLFLLSKGLRNSEITTQLHLSERTVKY